MTPKIKVTYIISAIDQAPFFETTFGITDQNKYDISVLLLNKGDSQLERFLVEKKIACHRITYRGKRDYIKALYKCYRFLKKNKPAIIHVHLIDAGIVGLFAGWLAGIRNRIYTRHGGSQKDFLKKGVRHDKFTDKFSTHIIATCENVKEILVKEEKVPPSKITIINLAFDMQGFLHPDELTVKELKQKYNPGKRYPVIGVIARWVEWKGVQYIIPAFKEFLKENPNALLVLANANKGDYVAEIQKQLETLESDQYCLINFEKKFYELYQVFDQFVHVPTGKTYEAFGQIYIEALTAGIPSVFTLTGIAPEIIIDSFNAMVVDYRNSSQITAAMKRLNDDPALREQLKLNGRASVQDKFRFENYMKEQDALYDQLLKAV